MKKLLVTACAIAGSGLIVLAGQEPPAPAVFTAAQAAAGRTAFQSTCGKCHTGPFLRRTGDAGELPPVDSLPAGMQDVVRSAGGQVPPLAGPDFMARWGAKTTKDLSARIREAVGGFPPQGTDKETHLNLTA
jgi:mono/diheme cytochrome c family protein